MIEHSELTEPDISVVTVTLNAARYIDALAASICAQTDSDFEWVVFDGGSLDNTVKKVEQCGKQQLKLIQAQDFGIYDALNKAIKASSGRYYLVAGGDDVLSPNCIAEYRRALRETGGDIISARINTPWGVVAPGRGKPWLRGQLAFVSQHSVGTLVRKGLHDVFGYYSRRFPIAADHDFILRACLAPGMRVISRPFVAGEYSGRGVSYADALGSATEFFRVQVERLGRPHLQAAIFLVRLIRIWPRVLEARRRDVGNGNRHA